jgi:hypothetical protein
MNKHVYYFNYCEICDWSTKTRDHETSSATVNACGNCNEKGLNFVGMTEQEHNVFCAMDENETIPKRCRLIRELVNSITKG